MHVHAPMKPPETPDYETKRLTIFDWLCLSISDDPPNMSAIGLPKSRDPEVQCARAHVHWSTSSDLFFLRGHLYKPRTMSVSNLNAIGLAVAEIWARLLCTCSRRCRGARRPPLDVTCHCVINRLRSTMPIIFTMSLALAL